MMEKDLCKFIDYVDIKNKDFSTYEDDKGNLFTFNTINLLARVDKLELTKEEYQVAKFGQKINDLEYVISGSGYSVDGSVVGEKLSLAKEIAKLG